MPVLSSVPQKIPIVSLGLLNSSHPKSISEEAWVSTAQDLDKAISSIGFVYLKDHGIPLEKVC
jgi:isopenicillin N synthase-like dioxygenase